MDSVAIDGVDIAVHGLTLVSIEDWLSGVALTRAVTAMPGFTGGVPSPTATVPGRAFTFESRVRPVSWAHRLSLVDGYANAFGSGVHEIETADAPGRVLYGTYQSMPVTVEAPRFVQTDAKLRLAFLCANAAKYDREPRSVALSTARTPIPLGTLSSAAVVRLRGAITGTRFLIYRGINGNVLGTLGVDFTASPQLSTEYTDLDLVRRRIVRYDAVGGAASVYQFKVPGTQWFALHPGDGNPAAGQWATLEVDGGTATCYYVRAWSN